MYEVLEALEDVIKSAPAEQRSALAERIDEYEEDFPEEHSWATGPQAPVFLHHLFMEIDMACRSNDDEPSSSSPEQETIESLMQGARDVTGMKEIRAKMKKAGLAVDDITLFMLEEIQMKRAKSLH
jgi:hypothetical protein